MVDLPAILKRLLSEIPWILKNTVRILTDWQGSLPATQQGNTDTYLSALRFAMWMFVIAGLVVHFLADPLSIAMALGTPKKALDVFGNLLQFIFVALCAWQLFGLLVHFFFRLMGGTASALASFESFNWISAHLLPINILYASVYPRVQAPLQAQIGNMTGELSVGALITIVLLTLLFIRLLWVTKQVFSQLHQVGKLRALLAVLLPLPLIPIIMCALVLPAQIGVENFSANIGSRCSSIEGG